MTKKGKKKSSKNFLLKLAILLGVGKSMRRTNEVFYSDGKGNVVSEEEAEKLMLLNSGREGR